MLDLVLSAAHHHIFSGEGNTVHVPVGKILTIGFLAAKMLGRHWLPPRTVSPAAMAMTAAAKPFSDSRKCRFLALGWVARMPCLSHFTGRNLLAFRNTQLPMELTGVLAERFRHPLL
jgi:hypothetical protein